MTLVTYLTPKASLNARYTDLFSWRNAGFSIEFYQDRSGFIQRLRTDRASVSCVVIAPADLEELISIFFDKNVLTALALVICLPEVSDAAMALAHRLYPRFIAEPTLPMKDVLAVVERIIHRNQFISGERSA